MSKKSEISKIMEEYENQITKMLKLHDDAVSNLSNTSTTPNDSNSTPPPPEKSNRPAKRQRCSLCDIYFPNFNKLQAHREEEHQEELVSEKESQSDDSDESAPKPKRVRKPQSSLKKSQKHVEKIEEEVDLDTLAEFGLSKREFFKQRKMLESRVVKDTVKVSALKRNDESSDESDRKEKKRIREEVVVKKTAKVKKSDNNDDASVDTLVLLKLFRDGVEKFQFKVLPSSLVEKARDGIAKQEKLNFDEFKLFYYCRRTKTYVELRDFDTFVTFGIQQGDIIQCHCI